jgi:hypothetical protein
MSPGIGIHAYGELYDTVNQTYLVSMSANHPPNLVYLKNPLLTVMKSPAT